MPSSLQMRWSVLSDQLNVYVNSTILKTTSI